MKRTTFGFSLNIDHRGREKDTLYNWGAFIRYEVN